MCGRHGDHGGCGQPHDDRGAHGGDVPRASDDDCGHDVHDGNAGILRAV